MKTDFISISLLALEKNNFAVLNKNCVNDVSVSLSLTLNNKISSTCKFNCEMMIIQLQLFVPHTAIQQTALPVKAAAVF